MTEFSMMPWETQTGTGDGANSYTQDQSNEFFRLFDVRDPSVEGVNFGVWNELAVSGVATPLSVASGAGVCYGRYWNSSAVNLTVTTPTVGTTGGRVVLRATWATNTIRLAVKMSADGNATIPALTQTAGTTWEISLATFLITTGGVITVTDDRTFRKPTGRLADGDIDDAAMLANGVITGAKIASGTVVPGNIADRTRKLLVPVVGGMDVTNGTDYHISTEAGFLLLDTVTSRAIGMFAVPADYSSGMTIKPVLRSAGSTGDINLYANAYFGAIGEDYDDDNITYGPSAVSISAYGELLTPVTLTMTGVAAGDIVTLRVQRYGGDASDTLGSNISLYGWLVEYTADS